MSHRRIRGIDRTHLAAHKDHRLLRCYSLATLELWWEIENPDGTFFVFWEHLWPDEEPTQSIVISVFKEEVDNILGETSE